MITPQWDCSYSQAKLENENEVWSLNIVGERTCSLLKLSYPNIQ